MKNIIRAFRPTSNPDHPGIEADSPEAAKLALNCEVTEMVVYGRAWPNNNKVDQYGNNVVIQTAADWDNLFEVSIDRFADFEDATEILPGGWTGYDVRVPAGNYTFHATGETIHMKHVTDSGHN